MIFEEIRTSGCCSYAIACGETCAGVVIDPELSQIDRTFALIGKACIRVHYVIDTHTHAAHFSASPALARRLAIPRVMHRGSVAPNVDARVDDGEPDAASSGQREGRR
jgi:glyoxylase-like metal-dependent hydrolase (beta-lactamase superfamily II)